MIPLVDLHCHLLPGIDDGPADIETSLEMCRLAYEDGIRMSAATPHQSEQWPDVTNDRIRTETDRLARRLREQAIPLTVFPGAEIMIDPNTEEEWFRGNRMSIADGGRYVLIEMPARYFVELAGMVHRLQAVGVRPILAHPERHPEFLDDPSRLNHLVKAGCLLQIGARSITEPWNRDVEKGIRRWLKFGDVHLLGSDGHSLNRRSPKMAEAYRLLCRWAGESAADRICSTNGLAVLQGLPVPSLQPTSWRRFLNRFYTG